MTAPASLPAARPSPRQLVGDAWRLLRSQPRATMLPMAAIQVPVALVHAAVAMVVYLNFIDADPIRSVGDLTDKQTGEALFVFFALSAFQLLFSQVARGATIVAVASAAAGKPKPLVESLDPAFTAMGGLLLQALVLLGIAAIGGLTVFGIVFVPYVLLRLWISAEVYMLEEVSPWRSLGGTWMLMRGHLLRLTGLFLLTILVVLPPLFLVSAVGLVPADGRTAEIVTGEAISVIQAVLTVPLLALLSAASTLFYLDLKVRPDAGNPA